MLTGYFLLTGDGVKGNTMRILLNLFLLLGMGYNAFACCVGDDRTLSERLFQGDAGTIFTCKVLTFSTPTYPENVVVYRSDGSIDGTATVELISVYFGKPDTNIVTLRAGSHLTVGNTYLIYTEGSGRVFGFGGICDRWSRQLTDSPESDHELLVLKQFSDIFKNQISGSFTFTNANQRVIARGQYKKGEASRTWQHFNEDGTLKAEFDLNKGITAQYSRNGFIKSKSTVNGDTGFYEQFSDRVNGQHTYTNREVKTDTALIMTVSEYYDNGLKKNLFSQLYHKNKGGTEKTGEYKEFHENGELKVTGQFQNNQRVGLWQWHHEDVEFNTEFDYQDGQRAQ